MEKETGLMDIADTDTDIKDKVKTETSAIYLLYDAITILTSAFVLLMILFSFLFRVVGVRGASMEDTLHQGDWLITVQKEQYVTGDIVVVTQPNYFNEPLIKRVIAKGGQTIDIDYELSAVYIDGKELNEPYLKEQIMEREYSNLTFPYTVEEGFLFVMGDNRNNSTDSRSPLVGPIDERYVLGRAALRLLNTGENRRLGDFSIYDYE